MANSRIKDNIAIENQLAYFMLNEITSNKKLQNTLQSIANVILTKILNPLIQAMNEKNITSLSDTPLFVQDSIKMLATQNLDSEIPFGGILQGFSQADEIYGSFKNVDILLKTFAKTLSNVEQINTVSDALKFLKSIADLAFCYFEYFDKTQTPQFNIIKEMIWLTPEESDGRILRTELDQKPLLAKTYGIRRSAADFDSKMGINSGKALFAGASMKDRLAIIIKQYDNAFEKYNQLKQESSDASKLKAFEEKTLFPALKKMQFYHIRLLKSERDSLDKYAKRYETTFEKLAKLADPLRETSLPLVANISRSTARTLISLLALSAFGEKQFDLDAAQQFANCAMSFYVWGGHHSITEVGEIYNRLLDYIALVHPEQLPIGTFPAQPSVDQPYYGACDQVEKKLPYYLFGDYLSFIHKDYVDRVKIDAPEVDVSIPKCLLK